MLENENPMKISAQQIRNNTPLSVIQERITLFENIVLNNFLPTIDQYLQDVHKDAEKSKFDPEVWKILTAALEAEKTKILNQQNEVIQTFKDASGEKKCLMKFLWKLATGCVEINYIRPQRNLAGWKKNISQISKLFNFCEMKLRFGFV